MLIPSGRRQRIGERQPRRRSRRAPGANRRPGLRARTRSYQPHRRHHQSARSL